MFFSSRVEVALIRKQNLFSRFSFSVNVPSLNAIHSLDLSSVGKLTLSDFGFRNYDSLRNLDISKTQTTEIKSSWFTKKSIEVLNASENVIKALKKDDMKNFSKLRVFNASFNEIKTIEANAFLDSKKLEVIALNNNQIVYHFFENLDSLKHLNLRENAIVTVKIEDNLKTEN
jgi:Leucine-rich repeat (LRR) protein